MAKWTNYYKLIQPNTIDSTSQVSDNQELGTPNSYGNYNWYHRVIAGSGSRLTRYREWDNMDSDIDISRALDLIAEEITGNCTKHDDPLELNVIDLDYMTPSEVNTVKTALRHWCEIHRWKNKIFKVSRYVVKFGDLYFKKKDALAKWIFIHPKNVTAAIVNSDDVTDIQAWQIKQNIYDAKNSHGIPTSGVSGLQETEIVPIDEIVRFTLNDDMSDEAPFGESVLKPIYKTFKQKELLEDAVIIYRIQRAPERRVFYIDVGKMPPNRVKQYLEQIKNEIRQKKIPTHNGANSEIDSVYNPQCISLDTKIPLLDGRTLKLSNIIEEFENSDKELWAYSVNPETGEIVPGKIDWAGVTRKNTEVIKITLDNGETLTCTPDHMIPVQGKGFVQAQDLTKNDSLLPFIKKDELLEFNNGTKYEKIYDIHKNEWVYTHRMVGSYMKNINEHIEYSYKDNQETKTTIHHKDFNRYNNSPENLVYMGNKDHFKYHSKLGLENQKYMKKGWDKWRSNPIAQKQFSEKMSNLRIEALKNNPDQYDMYSKILKEHRVEAKNQEVVFSPVLFDIVKSKIFDDTSITLTELINYLNSSEKFIVEWSKINKINFDYKVDNISKKVNMCKIGNKITIKMLTKKLKEYGFENFKDLRTYIIQEKLKNIVNLESKIKHKDSAGVIKDVINIICSVGISSHFVCEYINKTPESLIKFNTYLISKLKSPKRDELTPIGIRELNKIGKYSGFNNYKDMIFGLCSANHTINKIEKISNIDTGCITIDKDEKYHNYHTFAIESGIFIKNSQSEDYFLAQKSDGRGSKIETLPGGQSVGEISDVEYFSDKMFRGLRIPLSYMKEGDGGGAVFNDGKLGQSYITELRFSLYIERLQSLIEEVLDKEFKAYLRYIGLRIDNTKFNIVLPEPSNFGKYREQEMYAALLSSYSGADSIEYLSKKFIMQKYLQLSHDEIIENERMKLEEMGVNPDNHKPEDVTKIYSSDVGDVDDFSDGGSMMGSDSMMPSGETGEAGEDGETPAE